MKKSVFSALISVKIFFLDAGFRGGRGSKAIEKIRVFSVDQRPNFFLEMFCVYFISTASMVILRARAAAGL